MQAKYKVRLEGGREIGPFLLSELNPFIINGHILGNEEVKVYPARVWTTWQDVPELVTLFSEIKPSAASEAEEDKTRVTHPTLISPNGDEDRTRINQLPNLVTASVSTPVDIVGIENEAAPANVSFGDQLNTEEVSREEKTSFFQVVPDFVIEEKSAKEIQDRLPNSLKPKKNRYFQWLKYAAIGLALPFLVEEYFAPVSKETEEKLDYLTKARLRIDVPRIQFSPAPAENPEKSLMLFNKGQQFFLQGGLIRSVEAARVFYQSIEMDRSNAAGLAWYSFSVLGLLEHIRAPEAAITDLYSVSEYMTAKASQIEESAILKALLFQQSGELDLANRTLVEFISKSTPSSLSMIHYSLASIQLDQGSPEMALRSLKNLSTEAQRSPRVLYLQSRALYELGNIEQAVDCIKRSMEGNANFSEAKLFYAELARKSGHLKQVTNDIQWLLDHSDTLSESENAEVLSLGAELAQMNQEPGQALDLLNLATLLNPNEIRYRMQLYSLTAQHSNDPQVAQSKAKMLGYLLESDSLVDSGDYSEATSRLISALALRPNEAIVHERLYRVKQLKRDFVGALQSIRRASELEPKSERISVQYAKALIDSYEFLDAEKAIQQLLKNKKTKDQGNWLSGRLLIKQNRFQDAFAFLKKSVQKGETNRDLLLAMAETLMELKNIKEAGLFLSLAGRRHSIDIYAAKLRRRYLVEMYSLDRAIEWLQGEAGRAASMRGSYLAWIAELQREKGDYESAEKTISFAYEIEPSDVEVAKQRIALVALRNEKDADRKIEDILGKVIDRNPADPELRVMRFEYMKNLAKFEDALIDLQSIEQNYPNFPGLRLYQAQIQSRMGNSAKAVDLLKIEVSQHANSFSAYLALAREYAAIGELVDAVRAISMAMQLQPASAEAKYVAAEINEAKKDFVAAEALYRAAIALDAGNPIYYRKLASVLDQSGNAFGAQEARAKAKELSPGSK